ncbi:glycoside hydrolase family 125 protein [Nitrospirillum sp. BR 11163]|uniref:glycoside hydrolase family 125 protein n=1 Tax=Nitrospirillum sp. BR 11163 TaxID=3104323 RepID=UPI002AFFC26F|nr:glycoside hydrolase family 125 protein [Nitrospirillum sp. BR 11163]MEA1673157.1 glycoside hydrolase family 125 protein [Nitrospirillum sp. BR 11163]
MPRRRDVLKMAVAGAGLGLAGPLRAAPSQASRRPAPAARGYASPAVEAVISDARAAIADPELYWLFQNCYPNTLDTTVSLGILDGGPDAFVITGDIPCLWLRDSAAQVWPYLPLARRDAALRLLYQGLIRRQARCILIDPYANAFSRDAGAATPLGWAVQDMTEMKPGVAERKWEVDSLCHVIRLSHGYWRATGDTAPFDTAWRQAMRLVVRTLREQQRLDGPGPYRFQRASETPSDTLPLDGYGAPTAKVGLIHSMFRPSDDACVLPFLIPANLFAVASLRQLADMAQAIHGDADLATDCRGLADTVAAALVRHGRVGDGGGQDVWAYEVDGFGNALFLDDANVPSLLSLPYLGCCDAGDPLYRRTRQWVLSGRNPYFFRGEAAEGVGGPHVGLGMIWPMSLIVRALTSDDDAEIRRCLVWLKTTHAGTGFMHEAFGQDDPGRFTRPWFAWANSLFGELILDLMARKPALLRQPLT